MTFVLSAFLLIIMASPAHAYLDPGTGSMIVQLMIGAIAGGLVAIKVYWYRLKAYFTRSNTEQNGDDQN